MNMSTGSVPIRLSLAMGLLALGGAACAAAAAADEPMQAWLRASITLDATGELTSVEWPDQKARGKVLTEHLEKIIRTWEFEPGKLDGVPAITKTRLNLNIEVEKNPQGGMEVAILQAHTGVGFNSMPAPGYPTTPAMRGYSAELRLQLDVDQQGKVVSARVLQYEGDSQNKWIRQDFEKASLKAVQSWSFEPEQVAGKPLVSRVSAPILFCMGGSLWCEKRNEARHAAGQPAMSMDEAVALDSAVKIRKGPVAPGI